MALELELELWHKKSQCCGVKLTARDYTRHKKPKTGKEARGAVGGGVGHIFTNPNREDMKKAPWPWA